MAAPASPTPDPAEERVPTSLILVYSSPVLGVFMAGMLVSIVAVGIFPRLLTDVAGSGGWIAAIVGATG